MYITLPVPKRVISNFFGSSNNKIYDGAYNKFAIVGLSLNFYNILPIF